MGAGERVPLAVGKCGLLCDNRSGAGAHREGMHRTSGGNLAPCESVNGIANFAGFPGFAWAWDFSGFYPNVKRTIRTRLSELFVGW